MPTATRSKPSRRSAPPAPPDDGATAYARAVVAGKVVTGRLVRLACERHLRDLKSGKKRGLTWSPEHAQHAIDFYPKFLRLAEGEHAGQPFTLEPAQQFIVGSFFGWFGPDGFRRFRVGYIEMGKGNGKSPTLAGIGLYGLTFDDEPAAEIYAAAVTRDQARIMFTDAQRMVSASPALADLVDANVNNLAVLSTNSFFRPVSSEGRGLDGKRVHMALIDEIHEHPNALVVDKMRAGTKGRRQALIVEITNSGYDRESVCWKHHEYSTQLLEGVVDNDAWFAYVCALDACEACRSDGKDQPQEGCARCDDWRDERVWIKANPLLDVSITRKYLREQVTEAVGMPSKQNIVKRLNFCIWTQSYSRWLDVERWLACKTEVPDAALVGVPCFGGLDLGQSDDLCAFVRYYALPDGRVAVRGRYWLPRSAVTKHKDRPYAQWEASGALTITEGDITDYDLVEQDVGDLAEASGVQAIAYDKRFAQHMALHLEGRGITMIDTPQGFQLNEALRHVHDLVTAGTLCHGGDPILSWAAANMVVRTGTKGEIRPDKEHARDKIDPMVALVMAGSRAIVAVPAEAPLITVFGG